MEIALYDQSGENGAPGKRALDWTPVGEEGLALPAGGHWMAIRESPAAPITIADFTPVTIPEGFTAMPTLQSVGVVGLKGRIV